MSSGVASLPALRCAGRVTGITSVCSAHPTVIAATLRHGRENDGPVLIEATCNQVNQDGGYTGMRPAGFRSFVLAIAAEEGFDPARLILGGDHLGPNPWRSLEPEVAMSKAKALVASYVAAGFSKIHLDTSMGSRGEPEAIGDEVTAHRAARLARVAEDTAREHNLQPPIYVIGTEVPTPGGALHNLDGLTPTSALAAVQTIATHRAVFHAHGLTGAFERVVGLVVQPGVEFGNSDVVVYQPGKTRALSAVLGKEPQFVFEAHSTDYQPARALSALVRDGFAILKVGPWLTFALREALYGLDQIAQVLDGSSETLPGVMERLMLGDPGKWQSHYTSSHHEQRIQRHFSYSDRIRYYWPNPEAQAAVHRLLARLDRHVIPAPLVSQYMAALYPGVAEGATPATAKALVIEAVQRVLRIYAEACRGPS